MLLSRNHAAGVCLALACGGGALAADVPEPTDASGEPKTLTQTSIFASVKQSLSQSDNDVVRGHFDLGVPPHEHRYYCLVDAKTGRREVNAVVGEPVTLASGMTGIQNSAVSLYRCAEAEQQGLLVSTGYVLTGAAAKNAAAPIKAAPSAVAGNSVAPSQAVPAPHAAEAPPSALNTDLSPDQIDIAGVKLGMSPAEVRTVLMSKKLIDYRESAESLSYLDSSKGTMQPIANGRFVSVITAWTPPASAAADSLQVDGEYFEVMFTPVPGKERALGIVHSVGYSPANAPRETSLESGLIQKYGGDGSNDLPEAPTWRFLGAGTVQFGDPCHGRGIFGGLGALSAPALPRENLALKKTREDFQAQIERCGAAMVTEDHHTANGGALRNDRLVTRFTVTAYSPAIALEGASAAARLIQTAGGASPAPETAHAQPVNNL